MDGKTTTGGRGRAAIIFAAFALMIVTLGFWSFIHQYDTVISTRRDELRAVAHLKIGQISAWRSERLGDIRISTTGPSRHALLRVLQGEEESTHEIVEHWRELCEVYRYDNALLFTTDGRLALSLERAELHPFVQDLIRRVVTERKALFGDFFICSMSERVHLDLAAPILDDDGSAVGVLVLRNNPKAYLFPLIQSWPTPSQTAETLLVRKEGGEAVFLNTLRHSQAQPLTLRIPLKDMNIPAVSVISSGKPFSMLGVDYRGVDVMAEVTPIPDTPWFMVAKVDMAEVTAQARSSRVFVSIVTALGIACGALLLLTVVQQRERRTLRSLYESERLLSLTRKQAEESLRASEERWRQTVEVAPFPIMVHAEDGEVLSVNRAWTSLSGYALADIPTIRDWTQAAYGFEAHDVRSVIDRLYESAEPTREGEFAVRTANGWTRIWDFESAPLNRLEDGRRLVISMAHDITDLRDALSRLELSHGNLEDVLNNLDAVVYVADMETHELLFMNAFGSRSLGGTLRA